MVDRDKFFRAKEKIIGIKRERHQIGVLQEKTVHAVLKNYYEEDEDKQEIPIEAYVADIYNGKEIIEIQTAQFNRMRQKLDCFLKDYDVVIVHPVPRNKYLIWIDPETGEYAPRRKSPINGKPYFIFPELYKIKEHLLNPRLHLKIAMLDIEEFRLLDKSPKRRRKSAKKYDKLPIEFVEEVSIDCLEDYMQFVPYELGDEFISKEFAKAAGIGISLAQTTLNILTHVGCVKRLGKRGKSILYGVKEEG